MTLCAYCGAEAFRADPLCPHHTWTPADDWAAGNRIMCDFIHRGIVAPAPADGNAVFIEWAA